MASAALFSVKGRTKVEMACRPTGALSITDMDFSEERDW
jgi:hypothetical protein